MIPLNPYFRTLSAIGILAIGAMSVFGSPAFTEKPFFDGGEGIVTSVEPVSDLDVVFFRGGLSSGFRNGMLCEVIRETTVIATLILVEVDRDAGASLILEHNTGYMILPGDRIHYKTRNKQILS